MEQSAKREYETPRLIRYGTVQELTQRNSQRFGQNGPFLETPGFGSGPPPVS